MKMKNHTYNQILATVFLAGPICQRAIFFEDKPHDNNIQRFVKRAIANGHVKVYKYVEQYGPHLREYPYLAITGAGVRYLATLSEFPWREYLPRNGKRVAVFDEPLPSPRVAYMVRCGNTINFAINVGADLTDFALSGIPSQLPARTRTTSTLALSEDDIEDESEGKDTRSKKEFICEASEAGNDNTPLTSLSAIRQETAARLKAAGLPLPFKQNNGMTFYPAKEVRAMLRQYDNQNGKTTAFIYVRYTGILVTQDKPYIIYHAKHGGLSWIDKFENNDIKILKKFDTMCAPKSTLQAGEAYGLALVYNEKNFGDIINNKFGLRKQGTAIGGQFTKFHFVPLSKMGAYLANWLVSNNAENRQAYTADRASDVCGATPNNGQYWQGFRLKVGDTYIFDGAEMEAGQIFSAIKHIETAASSDTPIQFKVFCFQWQESFYRKIWPNVGYIYLTE